MFQHIKTAVRIRTTRLFPVNMEFLSLSSPMATISFDDFPKNAWTCGGELVEAAGGHATYYVSGSFWRQNINGIEYFSERDLEEVLLRGHDIGCHTFSHDMMPELTGREIDRDIKRNLQFIQSATGKKDVSSFAYPYGGASIRTKLKLKSRFPVCRGIETGVNTGFTDLSQVRAVCLEEHVLKANPVSSLIEQTLKLNGWLIFVTHDVSNRPTPFGCTPALLKETVSAIKSAGIELVSVRDALTRIRKSAPSAFKLPGREPALQHA